MDIIILANFCGNLNVAGNNRFIELATMLSANHRVEIITSDFIHGNKEHLQSISYKYPFKITPLHECGYKKNVSFKRFLSHFQFGQEVKKYLAKRQKPDVIYTAVPSLTAPFHAAKYCEKNQIRFVIDVQDLWPEAFEMVFRVPVISKLIFTPFHMLANGIYKRTDTICAVSETYVNRALSVNRKRTQGHSVYLGTDMQNFDAMKQEISVLEKAPNEVWMAYVGTLGHSYDLTGVFDAMELLKAENACVNLRFVVMGDGPLQMKFEEYAQRKDITVTFTGRLPYPEMVATLCVCDFAVNPIMQGAAQSIINKVGDYAAAGLAVVNTQECPEYRDLVAGYDMGINCNNGDIQQLAEAIKLLVLDEQLRMTHGANNRRLAEERFDRQATYTKLKKLILGQ